MLKSSVYRRNKIARKFLARVIEEGEISIGFYAEKLDVDHEYRCLLKEMFGKGEIKMGGNTPNYTFPEEPISLVRQNEIAWLLVVDIEADGGIGVSHQVIVRIKDMATELDISFEEGKEFAYELAKAVINKVFFPLAVAS